MKNEKHYLSTSYGYLNYLIYLSYLDKHLSMTTKIGRVVYSDKGLLSTKFT